MSPSPSFAPRPSDHLNIDASTLALLSGDLVSILHRGCDPEGAGRYLTSLNSYVPSGRSLVVELSALERLDEELVATLIALHRQPEGVLHLVVAEGSAARRSLGMYKLDSVFSVCESLEAILGSAPLAAVDHPETRRLVNTLDAALGVPRSIAPMNFCAPEHLGEGVDRLLRVLRVRDMEIISICSPNVPINSERLTELNSLVPAHTRSLLSTGSPPTLVVLNMQEVQSMNSSLLSAFVTAKRICDEGNIRFAICGLSPGVAQVFKITRLTDYFDIRNGLDDF